MLTAHHEPVTNSCFCFEDSTKQWISGKCDPPYSIQDLVESLGEEYDFPLYADPHDSDAFFGLCFGHFLEGELKAEDNELVTRMMFGSDYEADSKRRSKAGRFKRLVTLLRRQRFPEEFKKEFENNHRLHIDSETADTTQKYGNVYPKNTPIEELNPFKSLLCVISAYTNYDDVEKQVSDIIQQLHSSFRHRVVVYYLPDDSDEYTFFNLSQTRIDKATSNKALSSIKE